MTSKMREFKRRLEENAHSTIGEYLNNVREKSKLDLCNDFIEALAEILGDRYEMIGSCNKDSSRYLVPSGTKDQITYYGKPVNSFRVSDHWSWFSNIKKCRIRNYIQCYSKDAPVPKKRPANNPDGATKPIRGTQVCVQLSDGMYHCVFGEKYDRSTHRWQWIESDPRDVLQAIGL